MRLTAFTALIFTFLTINQLSAQILKIKEHEFAKDTADIFLGKLNLNFNLNNRNATPQENLIYTGLETNSNITYLSGLHAYLLIGQLNYFTITGGPVISTGYAHYRMNFLRKRFLSYEMFTQFQYDEGRRMPFRYLFGGGIRLELLNDDDGELHAGTGIMNEFERWRPFDPEVGDIERQIWKNSSYVSGLINVSENFSINIISYYQVGYDDISDVTRHRLSGDLSFSAQITGKLSFKTNFNIQYESDPVIEINPFVYSLTNGLEFNF